MKGKNNNKRISNNVFYIVLCLCLFPASSILAQIPDTCDPDYYDVLHTRSYVEGKREMEVAQRIILKPDSVLEYSCFNEALIHIGSSGGTFSVYGLSTGTPPPEFNGTPPPTLIYPTNLSDALTRTVHSSLVGFLDNFSHIYGGGTFAMAPSPLAGCNPMNIVWQASKCLNFDPGWWVRFEDLAGQDIRNFPIPCGSNDPNRSINISAALAAAFPPPADPVTSGSMNIYTGYVDSVIDCAATAPVRTGIAFELSDGTPVDDAVCIPPGCNYDGSSCVSN